MMEPAAADSTNPRAFLHVGGLTLARQQLGLVLALGCERIACIARGLTPDMLALQHAAEKTGAQFHVITGPHALSGLVTATDEVIALAEGLLVEPGEAMRLLDLGAAVLVQPIEPGLAAGFERIDLNHASAGALRVPGRLVERLTELPADCDAISALQRIALQAGVPQRPIGISPGGGPTRWLLVRNEGEAHGIEAGWIAERMGAPTAMTPGRWLARLAARRFGPTLLHSGSGGRPLAWAAAAMGLLGLGSAWFGQTYVGLACCGIGWILRQTAEQLGLVEQQALLLPPPRLPDSAIYGWMLDLVLVILLGWAARAPELAFPAEQFFAPAMLVALLRLVPRATGGRWTAWLEDRAVVVMAIALAFASGFAAQAIPLAAVTLALAGILVSRRQRG
ncbi:MAG TPA: hypothetical protein VHG29_00710 [Novosphingobium sp.]|nr:hypothetical protein [Novosphingobium sp.]